MALNTIGKGNVGHVIENGVTLCKRDASVSSPAVAGTRACKPCSVVLEKRAAATERATVARTAAEIEDYAAMRKADAARIDARMRADIAKENATVSGVRTGTALTDRASMVAPLATRVVGTGDAFRIPFSHQYNATMSTVWQYIAETTMDSAFMARVISRMRKDLPEYVFQLLASERDDIATHVRMRAFDSIMTLMTDDTVIRHDADHAATCDVCTRSGSVGSDASPFGTRSATYVAVPMNDGTVAFTYDRAAQCGECDGCASTSDNRWLTRHCEAPVTVADHVSVGAVIGRALFSAVRSYNARSKRVDRAAGDTFAYVTSVESADAASAMGVGADVPTEVADVISTACAGIAAAGADVIGRNGKATDDALTVLAIMTGNVTRTERGIVASPNQRRTAVEKIRSLWSGSAPVNHGDGKPVARECNCRWNASGALNRVCIAHGGTSAVARDVTWSAVAHVTTNRAARSGSANVATSPVAGRMISAEDLASVVYPDMH